MQSQIRRMIGIDRIYKADISQQLPSAGSRLVARLAAVALVASAAGCPDPRPAPPTAPRTLLILTLNDFHGQLDALKYRSYETPPRTVRIGGAEALAATVASVRRSRGGRVLLLDAGDFMQGSALSNGFEGAPVRALYHELGVAAVAVGNHEFDFGPKGPRSTPARGDDPNGALKAWARAARFPVLSANLARADGRAVDWPNLRPVALVRSGGIRVGIIGLTTRDTPGTTHPDNVKQLRFTSLRAAVLRWAKELRGRGAEVIVALGHLGSQCKDRSVASCRGEMVRLLKSLPPGTVHVAVAGHSHRCMWHRVAGTPVVQACDRGRALGRLAVTVGPKGRVRARALAPLPVCHDVFSDTGNCEARRRVGNPVGQVMPNPLLTRFESRVRRVRQLLDGYRQRLSPRPDAVIARVARPLNHPRHNLSPMATLVADIMRAAVPGAHVALVNGGGVRASLAAGPVTYADLYRVFPFDNQLAVVDLTGAELARVMKDYLEREHSGFMGVSGVRYGIRCGRPRRLTSVTDGQGRPLDPKRSYRTVISDFLLAGGVGFKRVMSALPASRKRLLAGRLVRDALIQWFKGAGRPINSKAHPVIPPGPPLIRVENGPCEVRAKKRTPRYICR